MDNCNLSSYLRRMFGRIVALLVVLSFAVLTAMTAAHAARTMPDGRVGAAHDSHMMAKPDTGSADCGTGSDCGTNDAAACAMACAMTCAGATGVIASVPDATIEDRPRAAHTLPVDMDARGRGPGLNERPPKSRLL